MDAGNYMIDPEYGLKEKPKEATEALNKKLDSVSLDYLPYKIPSRHD